jgi:hypothetical protein
MPHDTRQVFFCGNVIQEKPYPCQESRAGLFRAELQDKKSTGIAQHNLRRSGCHAFRRRSNPAETHLTQATVLLESQPQALETLIWTVLEEHHGMGFCRSLHKNAVSHGVL